MKLNNAADKERYMKEISEDRLEMLAEKARLEVAVRLHKNTDSNKSRYEIDAAIKVAEVNFAYFLKLLVFIILLIF
jgi:Fas-binding factor 1